MSKVKQTGKRCIPGRDIMTAYCGLACNTCPIYLATLETDISCQQEMRISIAQICTEKYNMKLHPEDINDCDGCRAETGRLFSGCKDCRIRECAQGKNLESCGYCADYACDNLQEFFRHDPGSKTRLEEIRKSVR